MSTFVPRGFTPFQSALDRLGPSAADEFRQALYAGTLRACLMDDREIPLPPSWWACDRSWNQAVATGRGSVSTGALYFETVSRGQILVQSDDVDRLLASLQDSENNAAPSDAAAGPHLTSPTEACSPRDTTMDPFEAAYWNQAQVVLWICSRDRAAVRRTSDRSFRAVDDAILSGMREAAARDANFFVMPFESAEQEASSKLSEGKLRAFGRKNARGIREAIPAEEWPGLTFFHIGIEAPLWPERSAPHIGHPDNVTGVRGQTEAANPPFWTDVLFEREAVLKIWPDPLEEVLIDDQGHTAAGAKRAEAPREAKQSSKKRCPPSPTAVARFLLRYADGEKSERECKSAAEEHFGVSIPVKNIWRPAWRQVPKEKKLARGQWSRRGQES